MEPFPVFEDDRVRVTATLVPHGPVYPSLAYRFDTEDGAVTFSGDTAKSANVVRLARGSDILVHEVIDVDFYAQTSGPALVEHMIRRTPPRRTSGASPRTRMSVRWCSPTSGRATPGRSPTTSGNEA